MAGWWLTYPSEKYSVGNIWQSQYMEKEKMFRITNQYITGNPSQISLALAAARSYPIHPAKPILSQKTRRLSFCMATSCSIYEPKSCRFFFGKHVGILFSPTHPPRHPTSCLTGRDAKVPGATALQRLGFQWPAKPPWRVLVTRALLGAKKGCLIFIPFLCLFVWIEIRQSNCWDHLTSDDRFVDTEKKMGGRIARNTPVQRRNKNMFPYNMFPGTTESFREPTVVA